jgi:hypothetical protein
VPALETIGFRLTVREPWWYGHRMLRTSRTAICMCSGSTAPSWCGTRSSVTGWGQPGDRDHYVAKRRAAAETNAGAEYVTQDNACKQHVIQEIYHWAFVAAGRLDE